MTSYVPRKGDLVTVNFDPRSGHEQHGRRPALVVSNGLFNRHTGLCIVCPITSTRRHFPFHVELPSAAAVTGFIMVEQIKSVDFKCEGPAKRHPRCWTKSWRYSMRSSTEHLLSGYVCPGCHAP